ncbi:hypothetical protein [Pseudotamlana carrageenivorans]|nr:hypothetical protein [Tamlana carrageenivorans]
MNNQSCKHKNKTDIVIDAVVTVEEIWTVCDDCSLVLKKRIET